MDNGLGFERAVGEQAPDHTEESTFVPVGMVGVGFAAGAGKDDGGSVHVRFGAKVEAGRIGPRIGAGDYGAVISDAAQGRLQGQVMAAVLDDYIGASVLAGPFDLGPGIALDRVESDIGAAVEGHLAPQLEGIDGDDRVGAGQFGQLGG